MEVEDQGGRSQEAGRIRRGRRSGFITDILIEIILFLLNFKLLLGHSKIVNCKNPLK